ncbi:MAG: putative methyl transferase [Parcubacteria group bacterium Athens1014_10]|nr:MAG: putative methyl transferase [Parcubacteria group bacterium Athens1014_10]TSD05534.1 MAG: putative methyl transferase [Parcubacteria group bacterium Athens0714_12]
MASEKRFGYEWQKYHQMDSNYEIQFKKWISPFSQEVFKDKKVLDAGCGMGRNSYWLLKYGAKEVVGFDFDQRSIAAARKNLSSFSNVKIEFRSIYNLPLENEFDIAFCIGVIHHLENPQLAIKNLIKAVRPGGLILIWVYGHESNEGIVKWINPLRIHLTSKLPLPILHLLTYCFSLPFWIFLKLFPQKSPYLKQVSRFKFFHLHSIIFDQLLPKIANYYKKDEACHLLAEQGLKNVGIFHCNQNSWTVYGYKI